MIGLIVEGICPCCGWVNCWPADQLFTDAGRDRMVTVMVDHALGHGDES